MNLPNKLTTMRVAMIPLMTICFLVDAIPYNKHFATLIFILACVTDFLDGYIARKNKLVTNFGKFMDPLADKMCVGTALILCVAYHSDKPVLGVLLLVTTIIIFAREFAISGFRLIASDNNIVLAASYWGKTKTVMQMFLCGFLMMDLSWVVGKVDVYEIIVYILLVLSLLLTIISAADYIWKNRQVLDMKNI
ncbi:MAG: CDP-diacylglycerol--glycerol-3-phosphate 3-phosphatidyltransferase [Lachnospiraceae bacterium]|nr:CDP-diacylglycerol--glycerol-3-phosphate 3-phosphatidyltransferase [Lachnospiraceae bacterium]